MKPLAAIAELLRERLGLDPDTLGEGGLAHALGARKRERGIESDADYLALLRSDAAEWEALLESVVVLETWFFRDREPFVLLAQKAAREWADRSAEAPLDLLSLPCATGEEAWSVAIALVAGGLRPEAIHIDALDVSERALAIARAGSYRARSLRGKQVDPAWSSHLQARADGCIEVPHELRASVSFQRGNLLEARRLLAGRRYDGILSRNLLIYCDARTRAEALATFVELLRPGGLLILGHAESVPIGTAGWIREGSPAAFAWRRADPGAVPSLVKPSRSTAPRHARAPARRSMPARLARSARSGRALAAAELERQDPLADARALADRGRLPEAAALASARLAEVPTDSAACTLLGIVLAAQGREEEAAEHLRRSLYLAPTDQDAMLHLALVLERMGQVEAATRLRERARRLEESR